MMRMAGISTKRIFLPVFVAGALISIVAYGFQEKVMVWAEQQSGVVLKRIWMAPGPTPVEANVFFRVDNYYFYVNTVEHSGDQVRLQDVMIYEPPIGKGYPTLTTAKTAVEQDKVWVLSDGRSYTLNKKGDPELVCEFKKMKLDLRRAVADYLAQEQKSPKSMTIAELRERMGELKQSGLKTKNYQLEYGYKLAIPLSSFVLLLCVAPLSLRFGRGGGFMGVLIGIVVLFFYWNVILFSRVLGETGCLPAWLAGWSEVIVFSVLGVVLMWRME
jgi:lipopolysaccharide export system permease protein